MLLTPRLPPTWAGPSGWEAPSHGLPDSTLLGSLAFPASQLPSATAAGSPQGCSLILGSHADMLAHACKPPASTPRHSPVPHPPVYPLQLGVRVGLQAGGIPLRPQLAGTLVTGIQAGLWEPTDKRASLFTFSGRAQALTPPFLQPLMAWASTAATLLFELPNSKTLETSEGRVNGGV